MSILTSTLNAEIFTYRYDGLSYTEYSHRNFPYTPVDEHSRMTGIVKFDLPTNRNIGVLFNNTSNTLSWRTRDGRIFSDESGDASFSFHNGIESFELSTNNLSGPDYPMQASLQTDASGNIVGWAVKGTNIPRGDPTEPPPVGTSAFFTSGSWSNDKFYEERGYYVHDIEGIPTERGAFQVFHNADRDPALVSPWGSSFNSSLIFREKDGIGDWGKAIPTNGDPSGTQFGLFEIPGIDHVALNYEGKIYESQIQVTPGTYLDVRDPAGLPGITVPERITGVVDVQTYDTFRHNSTTLTPNATDVFEVPIHPLLAAALQSEIESVLGSPYSHIGNPADDLSYALGLYKFATDPEYHKGSEGSFSCIGLIEWAAEQIGEDFPNDPLLHGSEGFIPDEWESLKSAEQRFIDLVSDVGISFLELNTLSPNLMYHVLTEGANNAATATFRAAFDPVDFIITDSLGRRLGYTEELGLLNEIPGAFYSGDGELEEVLIYDAVLGDYTVELFGLGEEVLAIVETPTDDFFVSSMMDQGQYASFSITVGAVVPEPSSIFLLLLGCLPIQNALRRNWNR